jgi:SpoVK/Ycf46/Vps4 family AAA+-type ATPase
MSQVNSRSYSDSLQKLFQSSIDYYCRIEAVYLKMGEDSPDLMQAAISELSTLFSNVEIVEKRIKSLMETATVKPEQKTDELLRRKKRLLDRIYRKNRSLHTRAENVKSLLQHELHKMNAGHSAMRSYKPFSTNNTGIIAGSI